MTAGEISAATNGVWSEDAVKDKLGINKKPIAKPGEGTQEMGYLAAKACIENANINPAEIDIVMCMGEEYKEYPLTTSALYIQDKIGAVNAWGIDVQNRCCTTVAAIKMAKDMLLADEEINTILIAGGYRNGDFIDYTDSNVSMMFNLAAGGGAVLLKKGIDRNLVLGSHIIADASLARTAGIEIGGQANPITVDNVHEAAKSLRLLDAKAMKDRLNEVSMKNWFTCIDRALEKSDAGIIVSGDIKSGVGTVGGGDTKPGVGGTAGGGDMKPDSKMQGLTRADIDYLAILHIKRSGHDAMLHELGLSQDQSIYLDDYGHLGQIDQLLSLELALKSGKVTDGSIICMLSAGIGYVWAANIIRWGSAK